MFDKEALEILLIRSKRNKEELAKYLGINEATLYRKMNGQSEWKRNEMLLTAKFFGELDLSAIFFKEESTETQINAADLGGETKE